MKVALGLDYRTKRRRDARGRLLPGAVAVRPLCLCGCGMPVRRKDAVYIGRHCVERFSGSRNHNWSGGGRDYVRKTIRVPPTVCLTRVFTDRLPRRGNLVACAEGFGKILQRRARAYRATGDATLRWCGYCGTWDKESQVVIRRRGVGEVTFHRECACYAAARRGRKLGIGVRGVEWRIAALGWVAQQDKEREARRSAKQRGVNRRRGPSRGGAPNLVGSGR